MTKRSHLSFQRQIEALHFPNFSSKFLIPCCQFFKGVFFSLTIVCWICRQNLFFFKYPAISCLFQFPLYTFSCNFSSFHILNYLPCLTVAGRKIKTSFGLTFKGLLFSLWYMSLMLINTKMDQQWKEKKPCFQRSLDK